MTQRPSCVQDSAAAAAIRTMLVRTVTEAEMGLPLSAKENTPVEPAAAAAAAADEALPQQHSSAPLYTVPSDPVKDLHPGSGASTSLAGREHIGGGVHLEPSIMADSPPPHSAPYSPHPGVHHESSHPARTADHPAAEGGQPTAFSELVARIRGKAEGEAALVKEKRGQSQDSAHGVAAGQSAVRGGGGEEIADGSIRGPIKGSHGGVRQSTASRGDVYGSDKYDNSGMHQSIVELHRRYCCEQSVRYPPFGERLNHDCVNPGSRGGRHTIPDDATEHPDDVGKEIFSDDMGHTFVLDDPLPVT